MKVLQSSSSWEEVCAMAVSEKCRPPSLRKLDAALDRTDTFSESERQFILTSNMPSLRMYIVYKFPRLAKQLGLDTRILMAVYGTLRQAGVSQHPLSTKHMLTHLGIATEIPGQLFDIKNEYPGLIQAAGNVQIEIVQLADYQSLWATDLYQEMSQENPFL